MIKLFKPAIGKAEVRHLYTNCEIPAKLFYNEVIGKSNLNALGEGTQQELESAFYSILDELCEIEGNDELRSLYNKSEKISRINSVIYTIEACLYPIKNLHDIMTNEQIKTCISHLNSIKYIKVKFDINKGIVEEIKRVETSILGVLNNQINELNDVKKEKGKKTNMNFEREVLNLARITGIRLTDTDTLKYFIELKNMAKDIAKQQNKLRNGKQ